MDAYSIQDWRVDTAAACWILELDRSTFANWMTRYQVLGSKRSDDADQRKAAKIAHPGSGRARRFNLSDLMKIYAMKVLVEDFEMPPSLAADAVRPYQGPYGSLLNNGSAWTRYPGTMILTRTADGKWVGADGPDKLSCIEIRAWGIFDRVFPRLRAHIEQQCKMQDLVEVHSAITAFVDKIESIRAQRWGAAE